jgi:hypothetical protein
VSTTVVVALVSAAGSVLAVGLSAGAQRRITRLKASLDEERAESDARRVYEYEALKHLYSVYEPLRIRMLDCTDNAVRQIMDMAGRPGRGQTTESSPEYRLKATIYYLLAPLVVARMIERRLTLVDLGLSEHIHTEFVLAQAICRSLADEARAAQLDPVLPYSPYVEGWREKRRACPQRYRRQGLPLGRLNTALDVLHVTRLGDIDTLTSFGEFEPLLDSHDAADVRSGAGAARDLFLDFDPATRPVLWRVLVIQVLLYWCYQETVFGGGLPDLGRLEQKFTASDMYATLRAALGDVPDAKECESLATTTQAAAAYFRERVAPALQRVRRLNLSQAQPTQRTDTPGTDAWPGLLG